MNKGLISNFLRSIGLIYTLDKVRYVLEKFKYRKVNKEFSQKHPNVKLPPDYLIYESFRMHYQKYFEGGRKNAIALSKQFEKHLNLKDLNVLDWGCGPGRIIRHLPEVIGNGCSYFGTDYNEQSIAWCSKNLPDINFNKNTLDAKLPYQDNLMDIIYGISIFTHLSEQMHYDWFNELHRVLKPGGILYLTTQGDNFRQIMTVAEQNRFDAGELVVRGHVKEGHRTYSAFHPKKFMESMFENVGILDHIVTPQSTKSYIPQDVWILRK